MGCGDVVTEMVRQHILMRNREGVISDNLCRILLDRIEEQGKLSHPVQFGKVNNDKELW